MTSEETSKEIVLLGMPFRSNPSEDLVAGKAVRASQSDRFRVEVAASSTSLLPLTFNTLWSGAINAHRTIGAKYFAMIHDDIFPEWGWLDVMIDELERTNADILSAVVPIKDQRGLTSTAIETSCPWNPRRLTMHEVYQMEQKTFTHKNLLVNSGLWVCRMDRPWVNKVWFRQTDRIVQVNTGEYLAQTQSEDWDFSRQVRALGGKLFATVKVPLYHESQEWHNRSEWGTVKADMDWQKNIEATTCGQSAVTAKECHANGCNSERTVLHGGTVA